MHRGGQVEYKKNRWYHFYLLIQYIILLHILKYCCPLNFKTPQFPYPQCPSIGVVDFFLEM